MSDESSFGPLGRLLSQVNRVQGDVKRAMEEAREIVAEGSAGAGMVTVRANGAGEIVDLRIEPELLKGGDAELISDLVRGAANQALERAREAASAKVREATSGLPLPKGFPFGAGE